MNSVYKTSKLVGETSIESSFVKNFCHGNDHTRRRRLRKENTVKTGTSMQKKLTRSDSARAVEETVPLRIFNDHVHFSKTIQTRTLEIIVSKFRKRMAPRMMCINACTVLCQRDSALCTMDSALETLN